MGMKNSDCRKHAIQCRELASTLAPDMRAELLATADMWDRLADDQESNARKDEIEAYIKTWAHRNVSH